jgi:hypothetical protein
MDSPNEEGGVWIEAPHATGDQAAAYAVRPEDAPVVAAAPVLLITLASLLQATASGDRAAIDTAYREGLAVYAHVTGQAL